MFNVYDANKGSNYLFKHICVIETTKWKIFMAIYRINMDAIEKQILDIIFVN